MAKDDIIVLTFSLLLFIISLVHRVTLPDDSCNLKQSVPKVF